MVKNQQSGLELFDKNIEINSGIAWLGIFEVFALLILGIAQFFILKNNVTKIKV